MLGNRCFLEVRYYFSIFTLVWLLANFPLIGYRRYKDIKSRWEGLEIPDMAILGSHSYRYEIQAV